MRGWDEFSEFLLFENRVPTSADFNTYPIRIFFFDFSLDLFLCILILHRNLFPQEVSFKAL